MTQSCSCRQTHQTHPWIQCCYGHRTHQNHPWSQNCSYRGDHQNHPWIQSPCHISYWYSQPYRVSDRVNPLPGPCSQTAVPRIRPWSPEFHHPRTGKSGRSRWRRVAGGTRGRCGVRGPEGEIASEPSSPSRSVVARRRRRNPDTRKETGSGTTAESGRRGSGCWAVISCTEQADRERRPVRSGAAVGGATSGRGAATGEGAVAGGER